MTTWSAFFPHPLLAEGNEQQREGKYECNKTMETRSNTEKGKILPDTFMMRIIGLNKGMIRISEVFKVPLIFRSYFAESEHNRIGHRRIEP